MRKALKYKKGFTLIEIIVVIAIISILSTVSYIGYIKYIKRTNETVAIKEARHYVLALSEYNIEYISGEFQGTFIEYCDINGLKTDVLIPINKVTSNNQSSPSSHSPNNKIEGFLLWVNDNQVLSYTIPNGINVTSIDSTKIDLTDKQSGETDFYTIARIESKETYLEFKNLMAFVYDTLDEGISLNFSEITKGKLMQIL